MTAGATSEVGAPFDTQAFLTSAGFAKQVVTFPAHAVIFSQGDACESVLFIKTGGVKLSVLSTMGREAVVGMLGPGEFFGESCLAGQPFRIGSATAITPSTILIIAKDTMARLLRQERGMADRFISHLLTRNTRIEEDLIVRLVG